MKAVIVAGGTAPKDELILSEVQNSHIIIGADKGCNYLYGANIRPNYIVGDFDSANAEIIKHLQRDDVEMISYSEDKDITDSEIALNLAIAKGAKNITLFAVTGTRFDHSYGNLGLLLKALKNNVEAKIVDNNNIVYLVQGGKTLQKNKDYKYISFLSYGEDVRNLSIKGAKYNLENYYLEIGDSRTVSNQFEKEDIHIDFDSGKLMIIYSKD